MIKHNRFILLTLIAIIFLEFYKIPYNAYLLLKRPFEERMIRNYGYCDKEGYGYIKYITSNYDINNNLTIINKNPTPGVYGLVNLKADEQLNNKIILINFPETITENIFDQKIKRYWFSENYINISNFKLVDRNGNCYYLSK